MSSKPDRVAAEVQAYVTALIDGRELVVQKQPRRCRLPSANMVLWYDLPAELLAKIATVAHVTLRGQWHAIKLQKAKRMPAVCRAWRDHLGGSDMWKILTLERYKRLADILAVQPQPVPCWRSLYRSQKRTQRRPSSPPPPPPIPPPPPPRCTLDNFIFTIEIFAAWSKAVPDHSTLPYDGSRYGNEGRGKLIENQLYGCAQWTGRMTYSEAEGDDYKLGYALRSGELSRPAWYSQIEPDRLNLSLNVLVTRGLRTVRLLHNLNLDCDIDDGLICFSWLPPPVDPTCVPRWKGRVGFVPSIDVDEASNRGSHIACTLHPSPYSCNLLSPWRRVRCVSCRQRSTSRQSPWWKASLGSRTTRVSNSTVSSITWTMASRGRMVSFEGPGGRAVEPSGQRKGT